MTQMYEVHEKVLTAIDKCHPRPMKFGNRIVNSNELRASFVR